MPSKRAQYKTLRIYADVPDAECGPLTKKSLQRGKYKIIIVNVWIMRGKTPQQACYSPTRKTMPEAHFAAQAQALPMGLHKTTKRAP